MPTGFHWLIIVHAFDQSAGFGSGKSDRRANLNSVPAFGWKEKYVMKPLVPRAVIVEDAAVMMVMIAIYKVYVTILAIVMVYDGWEEVCFLLSMAIHWLHIITGVKWSPAILRMNKWENLS